MARWCTVLKPDSSGFVGRGILRTSSIRLKLSYAIECLCECLGADDVTWSAMDSQASKPWQSYSEYEKINKRLNDRYAINDDYDEFDDVIAVVFPKLKELAQRGLSKGTLTG